MLKSKVFWLGIIFACGLIIRIWGESFFPPSLNWDEVSHGYNAYSLLKTGRDEWGVAIPSIFRAYGDFKLPVYIYLTVPVPAYPRFPSMVFGALSILIAGMLAYELTKKSQVMMTMAILMMLEPWTWFFSRIALEANVSLTLILLGALLVARRKSVVGLMLFWGLAMWTYNSARVFVPIAVLSQVKLLNRKNILSIIAILVILFLPVGWQLLSPSGSARFKWTSLLDQGAINRIGELRGSSKFGKTLTLLAYNKGTYFIVQTITSFASYFSPKYWLAVGGSQYQYTVQGQGIVFWSDALWFCLGILVLLKNRRLGLLILVWFILGLIPGSITRDAPHPLRTIYAVFPIFLVIALGVHKKMWLIFLIASLGFFGRYLFVARDYRSIYSWSWQYGYVQTIDYIKQHEQEYDQVIFTKEYGEPHEFLAYYLAIDPKTFQSEKQWNFHDDWYWVDGFQKYKFVNDWEMTSAAKHVVGKRILVVSSPKNVVPGAVKQQVNFLNGDPAFILVEI